MGEEGYVVFPDGGISVIPAPGYDFILIRFWSGETERAFVLNPERVQKLKSLLDGAIDLTWPTDV